ncbi:hypothetical protein GmHk_10G028216 [Glycine max]|nr:hypothetical protein GmHk_10G028216 [Glycine max]KAH1228176.1 hypothetical protein GmHk_10G028216 [Glycine max]
MATPPSSPLPPPIEAASQSSFTLKRTRKATLLRSLATRPVGVERPVVHVDPVIGKADGPHKKKLRTYLGTVARDKVDVTYESWKQVPAAQKDLIWEDIQQGEMGPILSELQRPLVGEFVGGASVTRFLCPHGRQDVLTAAIRQSEHPGCVRVTGVGVTIKQYFGPAPQTSCPSSSMALEELKQLT